MQFEIVCGDFLDIAPTVADSSVNLLVSDWPYYKVKALDWDRQWSTPEEYLDWIGLVCEHYRRILAPNGSLYAFAIPRMAARIELEIAQYFNVLTHIVWNKKQDYPPGDQRATAYRAINVEGLRSFFEHSEHIFFAEHYGADSAAKGESGYGAKCDELRGFVFEPLRAYLRGEWERAGLNFELANKACGTASMAGRHYFARSQWCLPTTEHYASLQRFINQQGRHPAPPYENYHAAPRSRFERNHSEREYLRAEYEDLRAEYEDLRRPFNVTAQDQYTDVWNFPTVKAYPGKHPCEKPDEMWEHIIKASSRGRDVIGDFFCGSGGALAMAHKMGRRYIGSDLLPKWAKRANERITQVHLEMAQMEMAI